MHSKESSFSLHLQFCPASSSFILEARISSAKLNMSHLGSEWTLTRSALLLWRFASGNVWKSGSLRNSPDATSSPMSDILKTDYKTKTNIHYEGGLSEEKICDKKQETQEQIMDSPRPKYSTAQRSASTSRSIFLCWYLYSHCWPVRG